MSDSRFHLKVEFEIYGKKYKWSPSLNWSAADGEIDQRIADWFVGCRNEAHGDWVAGVLADERKAAAAEANRRERAEYERLKKKYEPT